MEMIILFIVFLVFKLTGVITWSWIWITSPIWIVASLALIIFLITASVYYLSNK